MKTKIFCRRSRLLSLLLALCLILGLAPSMLTPAEAIYHPNNAPAATAEQLAKTSDLFAATPSGGMLRVIDGELYVWGSNYNYGLGLNQYEGEDTTMETNIPSPVKHDFDFGGAIVKIMTSCNDGVTVLTENGDLYSWGWIWDSTVGIQQDFHAEGGRLPVAWDLSQVQGQIVDVYSSSLAVSVQDDLGNWYYTTTRPAAIFGGEKILTNPDCMILRPIPEIFIDYMQKSFNRDHVNTAAETNPDINYKVENANERVGGSQRRTIQKMIPSYGGWSGFAVLSDGTVYAYGGPAHMQNFLGSYDTWGTEHDADNRAYPAEILTLDQNAAMAAANPNFDTLCNEGHISAVIDAEGSVWVVGRNSGATEIHKEPDGSSAPGTPHKVYDAVMNGAKCVKVFLASSTAVFLTEDNSLYAIGTNANQFISTLTPDGEIVYDYAQVFTTLSAQQTITGVYCTDKGVMVVTKSGETYWTGDNSAGTAGNGTTESPEPGNVEQSIPTTVPPIQPVTENKIILELEDGDGFTYRTTGEIDRSRNPLVQKYKDGVAQGAPTSSMELKAGKTFKLNVYFRDFGKITSWMVPIRFKSDYVKVVNGSGQPYADDQVVTPGSIGAGTGIAKCFNTTQWSQGVLIGEGGTSGTYPKICNADGWMSVAGYTLDKSAVISGEVKMFSVDFTVVAGRSPAVQLFDFATDLNVISTNVSEGYDPTGFQSKNYGPYWKVTMEDDASQAQFAFDYDEDTLSPKIVPTVVALNNMALKMYRSDNAEVQKETNQTVGSGSSQQTHSGYAINWTNTAEIYTIQVETNNGTNSASFPQSNWTVALAYPDNGVTNAEDYLTIIEQQERYLRVKLPNDFSQTDVGVLKVTAVNQRLSNIKAEATVIVKGYEAPDKIEIKEKSSLTDGTAVYDSITAPFGDTTTFSVIYPGAEPTFSNLAVKWRLLDKNHNDLDLTNPRAAATLAGTTQPAGTWSNGGEGFTAATATVAPAHTTFGDDYIILRAESLYDPSVGDEIKIKVHLKATDLKFRQEYLRMPTDTSKDLSTLLNIGPVGDYYATNLEWSYNPISFDTSYITFSGTSHITSGSVATPGGIPEQFEEITVTDTISGLSDTIKIAVLSLNSPIKPDDVTVVNLLGDLADYITVNGLEVGDTITFFQDFQCGNSDPAKVRTFGPMTAAQVASGSYNFPVANFLKGEGGEIGMQLTRTVDASSGPMTYDEIPVGYDCEPSKVYGYVRLAGKASDSARNAGIAIQLTGLSSPDIVYTDSRGYFEFTSYIIPGTYTMTIYQNNYLKRVIKADAAVGYAGLVIPSGVEEFAVSTDDNPIILYPGDLNADGAINTTDVNQYVRNWVGRTNTAAADFADFDFYDGANQVVDLNDLDLVIRRHGWVRENYPKWNVPTQS